MSNIYIQEPPTHGKVLLKTTVGEIDIELWSKEAPLGCRNFVQLCLEGYYDNCLFHRLVKGFIVQTGDPSGTGCGNESIYGAPFKDEFHSRLRFVRRGLVALANGGTPDDNGSQFFFTLDSTPDLQNKHTIFGKVTGQTLYNMLRLGEGEVDRNERPKYPHKIQSTEVLLNPFPDIVPREKAAKKQVKSKEEKARDNVKASKNFSLLSFGDEAEEEEEEITRVANNFKNKSKSSHDLLKDDEKLSSVPVVDESELSKDDDDRARERAKETESFKKQRLDKIKSKLSGGTKAKKEIEEDEDIEEMDMFQEEKLHKKSQEIEKAKEEFKKLKKQMLKSMKKDIKEEKPKIVNSAVAEFVDEVNKFKEISRKVPKKGEGREEMCWDMLEKFRKRLQENKSKIQNEEEKEEIPYKDSWLTHKMTCTGEDEIVLAKDANAIGSKEEDWFDIYDPRNPINKRRREG